MASAPRAAVFSISFLERRAEAVHARPPLRLPTARPPARRATSPLGRPNPGASVVDQRRVSSQERLRRFGQHQRGVAQGVAGRGAGSGAGRAAGPARRLCLRRGGSAGRPAPRRRARSRGRGYGGRDAPAPRRKSGARMWWRAARSARFRADTSSMSLVFHRPGNGAERGPRAPAPRRDATAPSRPSCPSAPAERAPAAGSKCRPPSRERSGRARRGRGHWPDSVELSYGRPGSRCLFNCAPSPRCPACSG